jgi:hypothetical protein
MDYFFEECRPGITRSISSESIKESPLFKESIKLTKIGVPELIQIRRGYGGVYI